MKPYAVFLLFFLWGCDITPQKSVMTGLDQLVETDFKALQGLEIGLITNSTARSRQGVHAIDLLHQAPNVKLIALFAPEHGLRGQTEAGKQISSTRDAKTGLPIFSLYGHRKSPTKEMLENIDALVFDIQDIGTRFYTYISTMFLAMDAAARHKKDFFVLDRPNPITGSIVEGPVLEPEFKSFVGIEQIALRHGMTIAELALLFNGEEWLENGPVDLQVVKMKNWKREYSFHQTGLSWIKPSPNINNIQSAVLYPGTGLLEGTNVSEGRGTAHAFEYMGAPWIDASLLKDKMALVCGDGIELDTLSFVPRSIPGVSTQPKYMNKVCKGLSFTVTDIHAFRSVEFGIHLLCTLENLFPHHFELRKPWLYKLLGSKRISDQIVRGVSADTIIQSWQKSLQRFLIQREKYLLYP